MMWCCCFVIVFETRNELSDHRFKANTVVVWIVMMGKGKGGRDEMRQEEEEGIGLGVVDILLLQSSRTKINHRHTKSITNYLDSI